MHRSFLVLCVSMTIVLVHHSSASACINDRATYQTEREFRTNYEFKPSDDEPKRQFETTNPSLASTTWTDAALAWSGSGLALFACGLVVSNLRGIRRS